MCSLRKFDLIPTFAPEGATTNNDYEKNKRGAINLRWRP